MPKPQAPRKAAMIVCLVILGIILLASLFAPLSPYEPDAIDIGNKFLPPSWQHPFGTDKLGRDYLSRALYGGRVSLSVGFASMCIAVVFGTLWGTLSGYLGGWPDRVMMRFVDIFMSLPSFLLIIILNSFISPNIATLILIIGLFAWVSVARIVRAETMSLKERDFILAARCLGTRTDKILFRHIIPNMSSSIIVAASISVAHAILTESALSFFGFGVRLPMSSWGSMLQAAQEHILDHPMLAFFPGIFILLTVLCLNVMGDILRGMLDPRTLKR